MITEPAHITFKGEAWVVLEISKHCLVVLTHAEFIAALKRGKAWRRSASMKARLSRIGEP